MIQIHQLIYKYPKGVEISFPDFEIKSGEEILILGASGCGKTTLLHVLGGLLPATSGKVIINDTDITQLTGSKVDQFRGKNIGVIFQKPHFARALTVKENLAFAQKAGGKKVDSGRIKHLLERLDIAQHIDASPSNMSEGEKQRLSVAMALINKPALLLADEPTASLDDEHANEVIQLLREMASEENSALAIVTHDSRLKEAFAERTLTLSKLH